METRWHFNTSIAAIMELVNELYDLGVAQGEERVSPPVLKSSLETLVLMLSLFAPHLADELWEGLGHKSSAFTARWPEYREELARVEELEIPVQVNGKLRGRIRVVPDAGEDGVREKALNDERVSEFLNGKKVVKVIVIPQRLVNIVVR